MCVKCEEAYRLLAATFGEEHADTLLWNATCFPFDGERTLEQAQVLVKLPLAEAYQHATPEG